MATKKDLVEAHAFSRRRLVTAFVSGAPGGREVEPTRPMRAVLGGVALSVLVLAGGAVAGLLAPQTDPGWLSKDNNLIASRTGGDLYLVQKTGDRTVLRPFTNAMSARLLLGEQDTIKASAGKIAGQTIGPQIGIAEPPSQVADRARLVQTGWTACTGDGAGISLDVESDPPGDPVPGGAEVVSVDGQPYLVADRGRRTASAGPDTAAAFRIAPARAATLLGLLRLPGQPVPVDSPWVGLFAAGAPIQRRSFTIGPPGRRVSYAAAAGAPRLRSGELATLTGTTYLATRTGLARLSPFALAAHQALFGETRTRAISSVPDEDPDAFPAEWPTEPLTAAEGNACARMVTDVDSGPTVRVVSDDTSAARLSDVDAGRVRVRIEPGYGALVKAGTFGSARGSGPFLVNADGKSYPIVDPSGTTTANLGYAGVEQPVVPTSWLRLLRQGHELSAELAGQTPVAEDEPAGGAS